MNWNMFILFIVCLLVGAQLQAQKISCTSQNAPLEKVFAAIQQQTKVCFLCSNAKFVGNNTKAVTINVNNWAIDKVLCVCLQDQSIEYSVKEKAIDIKGEIVNDNGELVMEANMTVNGTDQRPTVDAKGVFNLNEVEADVILGISYVGNAKMFDAGNVRSIKGINIEKQPVQNPLLALRGRVPGFEIEQSIGLPGGGSLVGIQGKIGIQIGNDPFIVIDGASVSSTFPSGFYQQIRSRRTSPFNYINATDIEQVAVLKDEDATSMYGSKAANGEVLITTKKGQVNKDKLDTDIPESPFSYINATDIEQVAVLKDADATSIYGPKAANGEVLITTKKGKVNKDKLDTSVPENPFTYINSTYIEQVAVLKDADATSMYGSKAANGEVLITTKKEQVNKYKLDTDIPESPFNYINATYIQEVAVSGDADATSMYGCKEANAEVLIIPKKGNVNKDNLYTDIPESRSNGARTIGLVSTRQFFNVRSKNFISNKEGINRRRFCSNYKYCNKGSFICSTLSRTRLASCGLTRHTACYKLPITS